MKIIYPALLLGLTLVGRPAQAQTPAPITPAAISPTHLQAANALVSLALPQSTYDQSIDQTLAMQLKQKPELVRFEPEMRAFFQKYMAWQQVKPDLAALYAREFTEPELREIITFYQTPVGQKLSGRLPQLMQAGMQIGQQRVQDHLPELQKTIADKLSSAK